jgi:hypothetical protein
MKLTSSGTPYPTPQELAEMDAQRKLREDAKKMLTQVCDTLLNETEKYESPDFEHDTKEQKMKWSHYRQHLRDLPAMSEPLLDENGELINVTWPTPPA